MPRRANYNHDKRQKELKRQKKQEAKRARRMGLGAATPDGAPQRGDATDPPVGQASPGPAPAPSMAPAEPGAGSGA